MEGQQVRKVRPENVHFAKKAKRVDVKRLKDDIWSGLKTLVPESHDESSEEVSFFTHYFVGCADESGDSTNNANWRT